jgi:hypothetical protein
MLLFVEAQYGFWMPEGEINDATLKNIRRLAATVARLQHAT